MKKLVSIFVIILLLCTVCIGFVACDEKPDVPSPETISIWKFMEESTFGFGKFEEGQIYGVGYRALYGKRYNEASASAIDPYYDTQDALLMENDVVYDGFVEELQEIYVKYQGAQSTVMTPLLAGYDPQNLSLEDYVERRQGAFIAYSSSSWGFADQIDSADVGDIYQGYTILKKEQKDGLGFAFGYKTELDFETVDVSDQGDENDQFGHVAVEYAVIVYDANTDLYVMVSINFEFVVYQSTVNAQIENTTGESALEDVAKYVACDYAERIENAIDSATADELLSAGQGYFAVAEEVIIAWLNDPRGQAYLQS
jgi:hypothetical protein